MSLLETWEKNTEGNDHNNGRRVSQSASKPVPMSESSNPFIDATKAPTQPSIEVKASQVAKNPFTDAEMTSGQPSDQDVNSLDLVEKIDPGIVQRPKYRLRQRDYRRGIVRSGTQPTRSGLHNDVQIVGVSAASGMVSISTTGRGCSVVRWQPDGRNNSEVALTHQNGSMIHKTFLDPTGQHLIVSLNNGENYYLHSDMHQSRGPLSKLKGVVVESVAWIPVREGAKVLTLIIGTNSGKILELAIEGNKERYLKELHVLSESLPICGLAVEEFVNGSKQYFVMAVTGRRTRCYQFVGGPTIEELFQEYSGSKTVPFWELPGFIQRPELHIFRKRTENNLPFSFSILTEEGIFNGLLHLDNPNAPEVTTNRSMLIYPKTATSAKKYKVPPISMCEIEFHYILIYPTHVLAIHKVSQEVVFEEEFSEFTSDRLVAASYDAKEGNVWIVTSSSTFQFNVEAEGVDLWKQYLDRSARDNGSVDDFKTAMDYCATDAQRSLVTRTQADHYLATGDYDAAAVSYANTDVPFEEVSLAFMKRGRTGALRKYLLTRLESLEHCERTKRTILATWLLELYLQQLNGFTAPAGVTGDMKRVNAKENHNSEAYKRAEVDTALQTELWAFMVKYKEALDPVQELVFELMSTHGREEELVFYAETVNDFGRILDHYSQRGDFSSMLRTLEERVVHCQSNAGDLRQELDFDLFYKYSIQLMEHLPKSTVSLLISTANIEPEKLLPAMARYVQVWEEYFRKRELSENLARVTKKDTAQLLVDEPPWPEQQGGIQENQAVRFLEHCIFQLGSKEQSLHNLLLSLYVSQSEEESEMKMMKLLKLDPPCYDSKLALGICMERKHITGCIEIKAAMGLLEDAVELALPVSVQLAKEQASRTDNLERKRKLWLRIVRYFVENNNDVRGAVAVVEESQALRIEDVLPYCPDFAVIDDLKGAIVRSLEGYNEQIEVFKGEMEEVTESAELIRQDIKDLGDRFSQIAGSQRCDLCTQPVISREFYSFPCTHAFHCDCLFKEVVKHVDSEKRLMLEQLKRKVEADITEPGIMESENTLELQDDSCGDETHPANLLDEFISASCPFCSDLMIKSIAEPFLTEADLAEAQEWKL